MHVRPTGRRGARDHGRERVGEEHPREDAHRRSPAGCRHDRGREAGHSLPSGRRERRSSSGSWPCSRRCWSCRLARSSTTSGSASTCSMRDAVPKSERLERAAEILVQLGDFDRPPHAPSRSSRSATGRHAASPARSSGARGFSCSTRRPRRSTSRRATGCSPSSGGSRRGNEHDLHLAPDGRGRGDRRPGHGDALGRDRRTRAGARLRRESSSALMTGAEHLTDTERTPTPKTALRRRRSCGLPAIRLRPRSAGRSTSSCTPARSWVSRPRGPGAGRLPAMLRGGAAVRAVSVV